MSALSSIPRMVKWTISIFIALFAFGSAAFTLGSPDTPIEYDRPVGLSEISYLDHSRNRTLEGLVWYPTQDSEPVTMHRDNAVFKGFSAIQNGRIAPLPADGAPLVIFSHGSGGNVSNQGWLAVELARQGAIVVAINHPGSTSMDSAPQTNIQTWNRPQDISFLIDSVQADPVWSGRIDSSKIAVVGHSLGGYTAMAIAGGEISLDQFVAYCNANPENADCQFYADGGVVLHEIDQARFEQSHFDHRVSAVIVIDPAFAQSFKSTGLQSVTPTLLIAPPGETNRIGNLQVDVLAAQLGPNAKFIEIPEAQHFSFLPECKPIGIHLLRVVEKDGALLCWPENGATRADIHLATIEHTLDFLSDQSILDIQ